MLIAMFVELIPSFLSATYGYQDITLCFAFDDLPSRKIFFPTALLLHGGKNAKLIPPHIHVG